MSEAFIACLNIERFRELLRSSKNEAQRQMLMSLIANEERKLAAMSLPGGGDARDGDVLPTALPRTQVVED